MGAVDEASARHPREVVTIENPMHDVVAPMPAFASGIDAYFTAVAREMLMLRSV